MKAGEINDHKNIELNVNLTFVTPSAMTKAEQDEMMTVSSSDESTASNDLSMISGASTIPSESYSIIGTKGSPCTVCSDSESICSVKDTEDCEKIILDDFREKNTINAFDTISGDIKLDNYDLKYTEGHITRSTYDIPLNEEEKVTVGQKYPRNLLETESPIKLNFLEEEYVRNNNRHTVTSLENSQDLNRKNVIKENKSSENKKLLLSKQDSNGFQTCSSQPFTTSHLEDTLSQGTCTSSSKFFVFRDRESVNSKWNKPIEENQIKTSSSDTTGSNKDTPFPKSMRSSFATGQVLESLKNKTKFLSQIYTEFKNELTQKNFLENISGSNNSSFSPLFSFKNLRTDDAHLKNINTASGETNKCINPMIISYNQEKILDPLMTNKYKHITSDSGSSVTKLYDKLDSMNEEISENSSCQGNRMPRLNKFSVSDDSFHSQESKISNLEFVGKENVSGDNVQGSSMNTFIPNQEIKHSFLNNVGGYNSQISFSGKKINKDTDLIYCDYCKKSFSRSPRRKMAETEKETTGKIEKKLLKDTGIPSMDVFLQIFNTNNILAKNILLAVSSKELTNRATYTNVVKYLRKKKLFSTKLVKDVKNFLQASVHAQILKLKGKRYILSEGISPAKTKRSQDVKKNEGKKTTKERKSQTNGEKDTRKMLSCTSKMETRKSRKFGNPSKNIGRQVVKKKSKTKAKVRSNVPKLTEGKKINQEKKRVEVKLLKKILIQKDMKRNFKK